MFTKTERYFYEWLYDNLERFNHQPIHIGSHSFYFKGVTQHIRLVMNMQLMEAMLVFTDKGGKEYDFYAIEYIGILRYDPYKGYYDADNIDKSYIYYPTLKELLIGQVFEKILQYCNAAFVAGQSLYLYYFGGSTSHKIGSANDQNFAEQSQYLHEKINILID